MSRLTPLSGFPELLPAERIVEQHVLDLLRRTFELHGFASVETRAVEPLSQLLRKGEIDKEVYVLRRLQAEADHGADGADRGERPDAPAEDPLALHFDLTVPFARYVLENAGHLDFPFRRYQIQKVWRGERPQEGRYREFTQADIDIVGRDTLGIHHDVEIARVMAEALAVLPLPGARLQVNNRKLMEGFFRGIGAPDTGAVMRVVDRLDKLPGDVVLTLLQDDAGLTPDQAARCLALAEIHEAGTGFVARVRELDVEDDLLDEGLAELVAVIEGCADIGGRVRVEADLRIARGLDYYTGTVFETKLDGFDKLGSICSGGRYESLASDGRNTYPGVGISLGISRLLIPLLQRSVLTASRSVPSAVLVILVDEASRPTSERIAAALRARQIACEVAAAPQKFGRQIRTAERRGIPFVWFPGDDPGDPFRGEVRDIRSGDQEPADARRWEPPVADRRPLVESDHDDPELVVDPETSEIPGPDLPDPSATKETPL